MCLPHLTIEGAGVQQFLVFAGILDAAIVHHHDLIRAGDGAQAMGDDQHCPACHQFPNRLLDQGFVLWIDIGCGLIQHHDGGILQHGPGDGDALPLTPGQVCAASAYYGIIALFQTTNKLVAPGGLSHGLHLLVSGSGAAHTDILPDALIKR